jgi:hypothetical protein
MTEASYLREKLERISPTERVERVVVQHFAVPLLHALGFDESEIRYEFETGCGQVDLAARKNGDPEDTFLRLPEGIPTCFWRQNPEQSTSEKDLAIGMQFVR